MFAGTFSDPCIRMSVTYFVRVKDILAFFIFFLRQRYFAPPVQSGVCGIGCSGIVAPGPQIAGLPLILGSYPLSVKGSSSVSLPLWCHKITTYYFMKERQQNKRKKMQGKPFFNIASSICLRRLFEKVVALVKPARP